MTTVRKNSADILIRLGIKYGFRFGSFSGAVQDVLSMNADPSRRLFKEFFEDKVELPKSIDAIRYANAWLVQTEIKYRNEHEGKTLIPFNQTNYKKAVSYGKKQTKGKPARKKTKRRTKKK